MSQTSCPFVWHDLITTDVDSARAFYARVLGWKMQSFPGTKDYTVVSAGSVGVGGITPIPVQAQARGAPPCWQGYVAVPDVDACVRRIEAHGGRLIDPAQDIPGVGRYALVADLHGAVFIVFRPNSDETRAPGADRLQGTVGWNELHADRAQDAMRWYGDVFGWTQAREIDMGPMGMYRLFQTGGDEPAGGMMDRMPGLPTPFWTYYFNVDALDAAMERVADAGGRVLHGPEEVPGPMFIANCQDPQGAWFSLVAHRR